MKFVGAGFRPVMDISEHVFKEASNRFLPIRLPFFDLPMVLQL
jgi:hypothetical protein